MIEPKTKEEKRIFTESNSDSYRQEMYELEEKYGVSIDHIYYSTHFGVWCLKIKGIQVDEEFETKIELMNYLDEIFSIS